MATQDYYNTLRTRRQYLYSSRNDVVLDIKHRLTTYDVISPHVTLIRAGNLHKGICPFHSEETPSFTVYPGDRGFHCFGCAQGGDIFTFLMLMDSIDFPEALRRLAAQAGVSLQASGRVRRR